MVGKIIKFKDPKRQNISPFIFALIVIGASDVTFVGIQASLQHGKSVSDAGQYAANWVGEVWSSVMPEANLGRSGHDFHKSDRLEQEMTVPSRSFAECGAVRNTCVVDGDTFWLDGMKIRIADVDTPEVSNPKCAKEAAMGAKATRRLVQLLNSGRFEVQALPGRDKDKYGRRLRIVTREGRSIGDILVSEGLARTWSGRREPWC